jgi:hypothetical protein
VQLELIKNSPELIQQYGVKNRSVLLNLKDFDICKCLLHDPMHVLIQGVCIKELTNLLKYLTFDCNIKLELINTRIISFVYPIIDATDRPNIIKKEHIANGSFAQSAGQMLTLMLNLPFILGDLFTDFDKNWDNFINLHDILNLVFCYFYDEKTIYDLEEKIHEYLIQFKSLYKTASFTPKMHYLSHFPNQLRNFGLIRNHACFRFEAKNGLITDLNYQNFINIAFSCANKHQFWMASKEIEFKTRNSLAYQDDTCEVNKNRDVNLIHRSYLNANKFISSVKFLRLSGFKYYPGAFLIINLALEASSSVCLIEEILSVDGQIIFYVLLYKIESKIRKLNCLKIAPTTTYNYINCDDLEYKQINYCVIKNSNTYLPLRYFHHSFTK